MTDLLASLMSGLAALFDGSMGWAILALALAARLALLPLTLHLARKAQRNQRTVRALQPQVDAIRQRLGNDPAAMFAAISRLYKDNGVRLFDRSTLTGMLVQLPVFGLLYKAISNASSSGGAFLWLRNLAAPDVLLTAIVLLCTAVAAYYAPSASVDTRALLTCVQVFVTAVILWKVAAGVGLYWVASSAVNVVQTFALRREQRRGAARQ